MYAKYKGVVLLGLVGAGVAFAWADLLVGAVGCVGLAIVLWVVPAPGEDVGPTGRATDFFTAANDVPPALRDEVDRER